MKINLHILSYKNDIIIIYNKLCVYYYFHYEISSLRNFLEVLSKFLAPPNQDVLFCLSGQMYYL